MATHNREYRLYIISPGMPLNKQNTTTTTTTTDRNNNSNNKSWSGDLISTVVTLYYLKYSIFKKKVVRHRQGSMAYTHIQKARIETILEKVQMLDLLNVLFFSW